MNEYEEKKTGKVTSIEDVARAHYAGEEVPEEIVHPETGELVATIGYTSTDGWRGYYEAMPAEGWTKVGGGCNCGSWGDTPPGTSDAECRAEIEALAAEHGEVVLVLCGGSNVFAIQYDLLARVDEEADAQERGVVAAAL